MKSFLKSSAFAAAIALGAGPVSAETIYGLTSNNTVVIFDSATPGAISSAGSILGLGTNVLTGFDFRPATGVLYSISSSGNLFTITPTAGAYMASLVGNIGVTPSGSTFGVDFNPVPDRLRFISDGGTNLRINPANAVTITDGAINGPAPISIVGSAYTNSFAGATMTTLYGLDAAGNQLLRSTDANAGSYVEVGNLGIALNGPVAFDISGATGTAYLNTGSDLYTVNLGSGATSLLGTVGSGLPLIGLSVGPAVPEPATWAMMMFGFGMTGGALRRRRQKAQGAMKISWA